MVETFAALAEPNRLRIVELLRKGARPVGAIGESLQLNQPQVSKHLRVLKAAGLVEVQPRAQQRLYGLRAEPLRALDAWLERYRRIWDERLDQLDELVQELHAKEKEEAPMNHDRTSMELQGDREILISRTFRAPATIVFDAWTKAEYVRRWWAPKTRHVAVTTCEVDLRAGGSYRYVLAHGDGPAFAFAGRYVEVTRPTRLVYTQSFEPVAGQPLPGEVVITVSFEEEGGATTLLAHELYPSKEVRDAALESGMEGGMRETMNQLDELVVSLAGDPMINDVTPPMTPAGWRSFWLVTGAVLLAWAAHNALLMPWEMSHLSPAAREPLLLLLRAFVWLVPVGLYLRRSDPRPPWAALGVTTRIDWGALARRALLALAYLVVAGVLASGSSETHDASARALGRVLAPPPGVYLLVGATLEELLLRGFVLRQLLRKTTARRGVLVSSALFAVMHLPAWIALGGLGPLVAISAFFIFVMGLVLGTVTVASHSIVPAIVVHFVNNVLADWLGA